MRVGVDVVFEVDVEFFNGFLVFILSYGVYEFDICNLDLSVCVGVFCEV